MSRSKYVYDIDFSHRNSIAKEEREEREKSSLLVQRQNIQNKIAKLYQDGLSRERIYLLLVEKMKKAWPQCDKEHIKNLINSVCDRAGKPRSKDFDDHDER